MPRIMDFVFLCLIFKRFTSLKRVEDENASLIHFFKMALMAIFQILQVFYRNVWK